MKMCIGLVLMAFVFGACDNAGRGEDVLKAHVFERKVLPGNKLLISYIYKKGQTIISDSAVVNNMVIAQDSVPVNLLTKK